MKKPVLKFAVACLTICLYAACAGGEKAATVKGEVYPYRWVFVYDYSLLHADSSVDKLDSIARRASASGLNGVALLAQLDRLRQIQAPKNWAPSLHGGPRVIIREDHRI